MTLSKLAGKAFVFRMLAALTSYGFVIVMARVMRVEDFGTVGTVISAALLFSVVGSFGQRLALLRFVPPMRAEGEDIVPLVQRAFRIALYGNGIVFGLLCFGVYGLSAMGRDIAFWPLFMGLLIVPLTGVIDMQAHLARAVRALALALLPKDVLWRFLSGGIIFIIFALTESKVSLTVVFSVLVLVLIFLIAWQGRLMVSRFGLPSLWMVLRQPVLSYEGEAAWRRARAPLWVTSVASVLFSSLDVVAVGLLLGPKQAALYFVANRLGMILNMFQQSIGIVVAPLMAEHASQGEREKLRHVVSSGVLQMVVPGVVVSTVLLLADDAILGLFGVEYLAAKPVLWVLVLGRLLFMSLGAGEQLLTMAGYEKRAMHLSAISLVVGTILIFSGGWVAGAVGVALGAVLGLFLRKLLFWKACHSSLGLAPDVISALVTILTAKREKAS
jgi:O-antigen/teichoic acid export membrane protein